ncbi:hypothetical protein [Rahnella bruchi]|uniref:hypothetical protein n=1 Tax=Rahnella bruchi TaxID=1510573 RepID=UPI000EA0CB4D|nr:hypothetical protein [Rahnella bruchi]
MAAFVAAQIGRLARKAQGQTLSLVDFYETSSMNEKQTMQRSFFVRHSPFVVAGLSILVSGKT